MCKKSQIVSQKPNHIQFGSSKLFMSFHHHRYLKKVAQDIRSALQELDFSKENDIEHGI